MALGVVVTAFGGWYLAGTLVSFRSPSEELTVRRIGLVTCRAVKAQLDREEGETASSVWTVTDPTDTGLRDELASLDRLAGEKEVLQFSSAHHARTASFRRSNGDLLRVQVSGTDLPPAADALRATFERLWKECVGE